MLPLSKPLYRRLFFLLLFIAWGCRDEPTAPSNTPAALKIVAESFTIFSGGSLTLMAIVTLQDDTEQDVTNEAVWSTSPGTAGEIDQNGVFNSIPGQSGTETVRAEYQGESATVTIDVTRGVERLSILPVRTFAEVSEEIAFTAVVEFSDRSLEFVTELVEWEVTPGVNGDIDSDAIFRATGAQGFETVIAHYQGVSDSARVDIGSSLIDQFDLVEIPGGVFTMGDNSGNADEQPEHEVELDPYYMGRHEVTNSQFAQFLALGLINRELIIESNLIIGRGGRFAGTIYALLQGTPQYPEEYITYSPEESFQVVPGFENHPVVRLTWYGAAAFCDFYGLRLPTEAEWEAASRAGQQLEYGTIDGSISHDVANYSGTGGQDNFERLAPVGFFPANPYGLYDMAGNAMEYVFDIYQANFYRPGRVSNPMGPEPIVRLGRIRTFDEAPMVIRGGAWITSAEFCRSASRDVIVDSPDLAATPPFLGFRAAKSR